MPKNPETIYPIAFGNEEETGMQTDASGVMDEPYELVEHCDYYIPPKLRGHGEFLTNGFRVYAGGSLETPNATNLERATPECDSPRELARYVRASELLLIDIAERYATTTSLDTGLTTNVRIQRRVVDGHGSRKACHDNFGVAEFDNDSFRRNSLPVLLEHLTTRSFITGAGYIKPGRIRYAQKVGGLEQVEGYGFFGSMLRVANEGGGHRIEVRCNDINISDWAVLARIGGSALALAIGETPLAEQLQNGQQGKPTVLERAKMHNKVRLNADGTIEANYHAWAAVDFQQKLAEFVLDKLWDHEELLQEYFQIATELYRYCEDYRKVLEGEATVALLADRADWAAKFTAIARSVDYDRGFGIKRYLDDIQSQAIDMRYDYIGIAAHDGELLPRRVGFGYKLRGRGLFRSTVKQSAVMAAHKRAPLRTRAGLRADLLARYPVSHSNWHTVHVSDGEHDHTVPLQSVLQTELSEHDKRQLAAIKRRR